MPLYRPAACLRACLRLPAAGGRAGGYWTLLIHAAVGYSIEVPGRGKTTSMMLVVAASSSLCVCARACMRVCRSRECEQ